MNDQTRPIDRDRPALPRRPAHVAGSFYPGDPARLARDVDRLLAEAGAGPPGPVGRPPLGALVPHAGLQYSGAVAARAWVRLDEAVDTVLIAGTNHFAWFEGVGVWAGGPWVTPLGDVAIDAPWTEALIGLGPPFVPALGEHAAEHSIEVQLPILARARPRARIVPFLVAVGDARETIEAGRRLGALLGGAVGRGERVVLVASSDLAHYPTERLAREVDERVLRPILARDAAALARAEAAIRAERLPGVACGMCGIEPAVFTLAALAEAGARSATLLAHATSADVAGGDPGRVVGYASVAFGR